MVVERAGQQRQHTTGSREGSLLGPDVAELGVDSESAGEPDPVAVAEV